MSKPSAKPKWLDPWLAKLLRPAQPLPVDATERTVREQHRRMIITSLILLAALMLMLGAALIVFGPGQGPSATAVIEVVVLLPLIAAGLFYGALYFTQIRARQDDADHPWRYAATSERLRIERSAGAKVHDGAWRDWGFVGYRHVTVKRRRSITGLELSLDGETLLIDLNRVPHGVALARAIVQQLAASHDP